VVVNLVKSKRPHFFTSLVALIPVSTTLIRSIANHLFFFNAAASSLGLAKPQQRHLRNNAYSSLLALNRRRFLITG